MEVVKEVLLSNSGMIFSILLTVVLTLFSKIIIKVFRMGVTFNRSLASKEELIAFKKEIRADMRAYKEELTRNVMNTCFKLIEEKLKSLDEIRQLSIEMKQTEARWGEQIKNMDEKYAEIKAVSENIRHLTSRVETISAAQGNNNSTMRRRE